MRKTPIPEDEASWFRSFSVLGEENQSILRTILERDAKGDTEGDAYGAELGALWASCMDEAAIERIGPATLAPELDAIGAVIDVRTLVIEFARLLRIGIKTPFDFDSGVDFDDASRMTAVVSQSGLGLPEREYYFREDPGSNEIRAQYASHIARTLGLSGEGVLQSEADAKTVLSIETELASASMTNVELREPRNLHHRTSRSELRVLAPNFAWDAYLHEVGFPAIASINVRQPEFIKRLDAMTKTHKMAGWRAYLRWQLVRAKSPWLSAKFVEEWFRFEQMLRGAKAKRVRWKRCVEAADDAMGEALAQPFVRQTLGAEGKRAAQRIVEGIEASMTDDIRFLPWMDEATRAKAQEKLKKIVNKIGFPATWRSYEGLRFTRDGFLENLNRAAAFELGRRLAKVGQPVDREEWGMTPPTVNAYYDSTMNEIVFPAGILRAPFYAREQMSSVNLGAMGMIVGHELTHALDDEGRRFDAEGNLRDWWSPGIESEFDKRSSCLLRQFDEYTAVDDTHVRGKLTLGENMADLGGVKLAFETFEKARAANAGVEGGFTPEQQFFVGFAQAWCANYRPEALRLLVATNPHSPPQFRVNGTLVNLAAFARAFECKDGSPMTRSEAARCEVW